MAKKGEIMSKEYPDEYYSYLKNNMKPKNKKEFDWGSLVPKILEPYRMIKFPREKCPYCLKTDKSIELTFAEWIECRYEHTKHLKG